MYSKAWAGELSRNKVEGIYGKKLPKKSVVHHVDNNPNNMENTNLVLCEDQAYHMILKVRKKAIDAGFPAYYRTCFLCKRFDDPAMMHEHQRKFYHRSCRASYIRDKRRERSSSGRFALMLDKISELPSEEVMLESGVCTNPDTLQQHRYKGRGPESNLSEAKGRI